MANIKSPLILVATVGFFCLLAVAAQQLPPSAVSELCLGCICEAISNCNRSMGCSGDVCGLFRITWRYWADAGKPVINADHPDSEGAYARCVTEPYCAARAVRGYMAKFANKDCNNDGQVDCTDFAAIHRLGGYGCGGALDYDYQSKFLSCQNQISQISGGRPL